MQLQKAISKKLFLVAVLMVTALTKIAGSGVDPITDPIVRGTDQRIRIRSTNNATLLVLGGVPVSMCGSRLWVGPFLFLMRLLPKYRAVIVGESMAYIGTVLMGYTCFSEIFWRSNIYITITISVSPGSGSVIICTNPNPFIIKQKQ